MDMCVYTFGLAGNDFSQVCVTICSSFCERVSSNESGWDDVDVDVEVGSAAPDMQFIHSVAAATVSQGSHQDRSVSAK